MGGNGFGTPAADYRWREKVSRSPRVLRISRAQEIQTSRTGVPKQVSRLYGLLGLQRREAAHGGSAGKNRGQGYLRSLFHDSGTCSAVLRAGGTDPGRS